MRITADLHIHSHFSLAASARLTPPWLERWAWIKGIKLLGAGDCTHPRWLAELREQLEEAEEGLYVLKGEIRRAFDARFGEELPLPGRGAGESPSGGPLLSQGNPQGDIPRFVLSAEVSAVYKREGRTRKVHHLILFPDFKAAEAFQRVLGRRCNTASDGRPVLGIDSRELLALLLDTDRRAVLIPAHIWTPWFSVLGARSGFDSVEECYGDLAAAIPAIETGLSSNPAMNWALSSLDRFSIISNSDAHSPEKLGREATVFDMDLSYPSLRSALEDGNGGPAFPKIIETIELFPQEGKYYCEGHRKCGVCRAPGEIAGRREVPGGGKSGEICPVCGKALTRGVMSRVLELADRPISAGVPAGRRPYRSLIPLKELLGELLQSGPASKKVARAYTGLIGEAGPEFFFLLEMPLGEIQRLRCPGLSGELLGEAVARMRSGKLFISPGYDGNYGVIRVFPPDRGPGFRRGRVPAAGGP
jgi:uncharacterized protein (TIGR00375 family)